MKRQIVSAITAGALLFWTISCGTTPTGSDVADLSEVIQIRPDYNDDDKTLIIMPSGKSVTINDFSLPLTKSQASELAKTKGVLASDAKPARSKFTTQEVPVMIYGGLLFTIEPNPKTSDATLITECLTDFPLVRINVTSLETGQILGRILLNIWADGNSYIIEFAAYGEIFPGPTGTGICRVTRASPAKLATEIKTILVDSILPAIYDFGKPVVIVLASVLLACVVAYLLPLISSGALVLPAGFAGLMPYLAL